MAYNSKYTGQEVENLLDQVANGNTGGGGTQVQADWQEYDENSPSYIKNKPNIWQEYQDGQPVGPTVFESPVSISEFDFDNSDGHVNFDYEGIHYTYGPPFDMSSIDIIHTGDGTKFLADDGTYKEASGGAEPMICAYRITSYIASHIELENYTYNGQTMYYREGAIILITNPLGEDVVFEGGTLTLDGNEYEADAFTIKVGATALFTLGVDSGILFPVSSVEGATTAYVDQAISNAITNTLNTPV